MGRVLVAIALLGAAASVSLRGPDDHMVHEAAEHSAHPAVEAPETAVEKEFVVLDRNGDKVLDAAELTYRQYSSGCDPIEAQIRAQDYMICGDANKDGSISVDEFEASADPAWAECVRGSRDRRAHTFYRFFEADANFDGVVDETELRVEIHRMWGKAGEAIVEPVLVCTDSNKDLVIDQDEFHKSLAAYNPAAQSWQLLYHDGDAAVLTCLDAAMKDFDAQLAFAAVDGNKDGKLSKGESYDTLGNLGMEHATADKLFADADADKDGYLSLEEFKAAGANHKPAAASFLLHGKAPATATGAAALGMGAVCAARPTPTYNLWEEDAAIAAAHARKVHPKKH